MSYDPHGAAVCFGVCVGTVVLGGITLHYIRNTFNETITYDDAVLSGWTQLGDAQNVFHTMGGGNENNIKLVSPDGYSELIFDGDSNLVTGPAVYGTFNYIPSGGLLGNIGHTAVDITPYMVLGNTPTDLLNGDRFDTLFEVLDDTFGSLFPTDFDALADPTGNTPLGPDGFDGIGPNDCFF